MDEVAVSAIGQTRCGRGELLNSAFLVPPASQFQFSEFHSPVSRLAPRYPRGFTVHVAHPIRSIQLLVAPEPCAKEDQLLSFAPCSSSWPSDDRARRRATRSAFAGP